MRFSQICLLSIFPLGEESFCVGKENGIYADPYDETAFYLCDDQKTTKKFCPTGLKFNPVISMCDVPQDVRYTGNDVDSFEYQVRPKGKPRWTSLQGTKGLKVLSFGSPDETKILPKVKPHKLLSINIFHSPHLIQKGKETGKNPLNETEWSLMVMWLVLCRCGGLNSLNSHFSGICLE